MAEYKTTSLYESTDKGSQEGMPSDSFNNSMLGEPMTGTTAGAVSKNKKKYGIFGSDESVGSHFGRSGSPSGSKKNWD